MDPSNRQRLRRDANEPFQTEQQTQTHPLTDWLGLAQRKRIQRGFIQQSRVYNEKVMHEHISALSGKSDIHSRPADLKEYKFIGEQPTAVQHSGTLISSSCRNPVQLHEQSVSREDLLHLHRPALNCDKQHLLSSYKMNGLWAAHPLWQTSGPKCSLTQSAPIKEAGRSYWSAVVFHILPISQVHWQTTQAISIR